MVTSIFSFSHNVFKRLFFQKSELCGKGATRTVQSLDDFSLVKEKMLVTP